MDNSDNKENNENKETENKEELEEEGEEYYTDSEEEEEEGEIDNRTLKDFTYGEIKLLYEEIGNIDKEIKKTVKNKCLNNKIDIKTLNEILKPYNEIVIMFDNIWSFNYTHKEGDNFDKYRDMLGVYFGLKDILKSLNSQDN